MMEEKDIALNKRSCSFILQAFCKRGYMEQVCFDCGNSITVTYYGDKENCL